MFPHDLGGQPLALPDGDRRSLVLCTGTNLRHQRLGYAIQHRFPGLLVTWLAFGPRPAVPGSTARRKLHPARFLPRGGLDVRSLRKSAQSGAIRRVLDGVERRLVRRRTAAIPVEMFGAEVARLERGATVHPRRVHTFDDQLVRELEQTSPYLIAAFGGPLIPGRVLRCARGVAINQHAGYSPTLKGANTIDAALYHRKVAWVGSTVHVMDTQADAGPILRRSTATLHPEDSPAHCLNAVVALGNELMLDVIDDILAGREIMQFPQPRGGETLLMSDLDATRRAAVRRDFASGWLGYALAAARRY